MANTEPTESTPPEPPPSEPPPAVVEPEPSWLETETRGIDPSDINIKRR